MVTVKKSIRKSRLMYKCNRACVPGRMLGVTSRAWDSSPKSRRLSSHRIPQVGDMGSANSGGIWRGRWILTVTLLVVAGIGVGIASALLPRTYQANASVVLLASRSQSGGTGGNPYLIELIAHPYR